MSLTKHNRILPQRGACFFFPAISESAVGSAGLGSYTAGVSMEFWKYAFRVGEMIGFGGPPQKYAFRVNNLNVFMMPDESSSWLGAGSSRRP